MVESGDRASTTWPIEYYFVLVSLVADFLALLAWLGFTPDAMSRFVVVVTLGATGVVFSLVSLILASRMALSVRGAFYPRRRVLLRVLASMLGLLMSSAILWLGLPGAVDSVDPVPNSPSPIASPTR